MVKEQIVREPAICRAEPCTHSTDGVASNGLLPEVALVLSQGVLKSALLVSLDHSHWLLFVFNAVELAVKHGPNVQHMH